MTDEISQRWNNRFGGALIERLKSALLKIDQQIGLPLPDCLPILKYGLFSPVNAIKGVKTVKGARTIKALRVPDEPTAPSLPALLSKILLAFALQYEQANPLSLAVSANILRVLTVEGIPLRNIGPLAGVSKESVNMAMSILKKGWVIEGPNITGRGKAVGLTEKGARTNDFTAFSYGPAQRRVSGRKLMRRK